MSIFVIFSLLYLMIFISSTLSCFIISRYKFLTSIIISLCTNGAVAAICMLLTMHNGYALTRPFIVILFLCSNILLSMILSVNRDYRAFFSATLVISFAVAAMSLTEIILVFTENIAINISLALIVSAISYGVIAYFAIRWLAPVVHRLMGDMPEVWSKLWLIPCSFIVLHFLLAISPCNVDREPAIAPALIALILIQIFIYYFIFNFYKRFMNEIEEKQNIKAQNALAALVLNQQDHILETENRIKVFRHDTRHFLQILMTCLSDGNAEKAQSIIKEMDENINEQTEIVTYCSNLLLNAVISNYKTRAEQNSISFNADIRLPSALPVNEMDFSIVASNALENAIHACHAVTGERKPSISISCAMNDNSFFLEVRNTYEGTIYFDPNGNLPVSIDEQHGLGTRSISSFAEKYNALLDYNTDNGIFTLHMLLYFQQENLQEDSK